MIAFSLFLRPDYHDVMHSAKSLHIRDHTVRKLRLHRKLIQIYGISRPTTLL